MATNNDNYKQARQAKPTMNDEPEWDVPKPVHRYSRKLTRRPHSKVDYAKAHDIHLLVQEAGDTSIALDWLVIKLMEVRVKEAFLEGVITGVIAARS